MKADKKLEFRKHGNDKRMRSRWRRPYQKAHKDIEHELEVVDLMDGSVLPVHHVDPSPEARELILGVLVGDGFVKLYYDDGSFDLIWD